MKYLLFLLFPLLALANPIETTCPYNVIWGTPVLQSDINTQYLCKKSYAINYSYNTKTPNYVLEHLTPKMLSGNITRTNNFKEDSKIPRKYRATINDYLNSGYDRGHMAPAGDFSFDLVSMKESFLLSNMIPQDATNNRGIWKVLEEHVRDMSSYVPDTFVITGTIYGADYRFIGNRVGIPESMYKVIIQPTINTMVAYEVPNKPINSANLMPYKVTVSSLELKTGINFSPFIPAQLHYLETR
jgi:endonuclease G